MSKTHWTKIIGKSIFYAGLQIALSSLLISSLFDIKSFSKDQQTLQNAADSLREYIIVGIIWTLGTALILYSDYSWYGVLTGVAINLVIMAWIVYEYILAFRYAVEKYHLQMPKILS